MCQRKSDRKLKPAQTQKQKQIANRRGTRAAHTKHPRRLHSRTRNPRHTVPPESGKAFGKPKEEESSERVSRTEVEAGDGEPLETGTTLLCVDDAAWRCSVQMAVH